MISGYFAQNVLGFLLSLSFYIWCRRPSQTRAPRPSSKYVKCLEGALNTYQNSAIFFAFIIQITTTIFRARGDYGAKRVGLSGGSSQLGWVVSLLTFIPLLYPLVIRSMKGEPGLIRPQLNMLFILGCGILHGYIALSRLWSYTSPPLTGIPLSGPEWEFLGRVCYDPATKLSDRELNALSISALVESLVVLLLAFYKLIAVFGPSNGRISGWVSSQKLLGSLRERLRPILYLAILPLFAISQGYALIRMRREQKGMAQHVGYEFTADEWSFGQIASLLIWMPVFVEPVCIFLETRHQGELP